MKILLIHLHISVFVSHCPGEQKLSAELRKLYKDIDAVEFVVGLMLEKRRQNALFGGTILDIGAPFSVKGLLSNPICSPHYWKPSTFGGDVGFDIIKTATLKKLFCRNIPGECPLVSFRVPEFQKGDVDEHNNYIVHPIDEEEIKQEKVHASDKVNKKDEF